MSFIHPPVRPSVHLIVRLPRPILQMGGMASFSADHCPRRLSLLSTSLCIGYL